MRPNCKCHGEPMGWRNDSRYRGGGFHLCAVKDRERFAARYANPDFRERALAQRRDRYDADPIYRIEKRLHDNARRRAQTLKRRKERFHPASTSSLGDD